MAPDPIDTLLIRLDSYVATAVRAEMTERDAALFNATSETTIKIRNERTRSLFEARANLAMALRSAFAGRGSGSSQRMNAVRITIDQDPDSEPDPKDPKDKP